MNNGFYEFSKGKQETITTSSVFPYTGSAIISGSLIVTGSLLISGSITGSLFGTSSFAVSSSRSISSSFATTSSFAVSASWAPTQTINTSSFATTGSNTFIGNQIITGSLNISGSTTQVGTNNLLGQTNLSGSIIVSGTMQANANVTIGGTLRLDPAQDPGSTNATASFLFTSASNTAQGYDLYYRQSDNIVKFKWLEGGISTGLLYGGVVSASGTTIYVSSGSGLIMTSNASLNKEISPTFKYVTWNNYSASATYLTSSQNTFVYVDDTGVVRQQPNYFAETQYQEAICLGRATHANYTTITGVGSNVQTTYDSDAQQNDFIRAFGPLKTSGLTVTGQTNTLRLNIGAGQSYNLGGFYPQNPDHPSDYTSNAFLTASIARAHRSGSGIYLDNNAGAFYTTIDPTKYDNGSGVLQNTGTGNWTIQRVFVNPVSGRVVVYYGQTRYTTQINALQYLNTDPFTEGEFTAKSLIFAGYLVLKGNTTDLTDPENTIIQSGIFRNTAGGSASTGTVSLALDNLSDVNITTPTDGQALIYNSGTWQNGTPISASYALTASSVQGGNGSFSGSFSGSGENLNSIPASAITGLNLSQIATGSVTASVSPTQFTVSSASVAELVVTGTGVTLGSALTDTHRVTGSLNITGSITATTYNNLINSLKTANRTQGIDFFDDFLGTNDNSGISVSTGVAINATGTGTINRITGVYPNRTNQQGVLLLATGTTTTGGGNFRLGSVNAPTFFIGTGAISYEVYINIETLSTLANRFVNVFGLYTGANAANSLNGIFFVYDEGGTWGFGAIGASPNWRCITVNAGTRTVTDSTVAVTASAWTKLRLEVNSNATSVSFYIDDVLIGTPHTTNIPATTTAMLFFNAILKSTGTTSVQMFADYLSLNQDFTTLR